MVELSSSALHLIVFSTATHLKLYAEASEELVEYLMHYETSTSRSTSTSTERKIFGVRRLGLNIFYSFLRSCGRRGSLLVVVRVKACISNAVEFNTREMLGEVSCVRKSSKKKLSPAIWLQTPITVP